MLSCTLKDLRIISELDRDSRQSISSIARNVGLSKQVVANRFKMLLEHKIINSLLPIIDSQRLGYTFYNLFFHVRQKKIKSMITYLKAQPEVSWLVTTAGRWNILAAVLVKDAIEIQEVLERVQEKFNNSIEDKSFQIIIDAIPCTKKQLPITARPAGRQQYYGRRTMYTLDETDKKLLKELNNNVRLSSLSLAEKLLLSPNTVKARIKKLFTDGLIQSFSIKVNPLKLGLEWYYVLFELESATREQKRAFHETLKQHPNVVFVANAIGAQTLNVDFHVKNNVELQELLHNLADEYSFIKKAEPLLITEEHKCTFLPETLTGV